MSPSFGARANAAAAIDEMAERADGVVLHSSDLALLSGHPAGLSQRRAAGRLGTALWEVFPGHVALLDRDGMLVSVNEAWRRYALENGGTPAAGLGTNYLHVCDAAGSDGEPEAAEAADLVRQALGGVQSDRKVHYACSDGRWFSVQAVPIPGRHSGALVVHTDVTADRQDVHHWRHQALHDPLTGLPNRALLGDRLAHAVAGAGRNPNSVAVLFVDLDDFKTVNDSYGHGAGDRVLVEAAARMAASVRSGDTLGRWGGDEFLVIAERLESADAAAELAERLAASLELPISIGDVHVAVGLTVGVAFATPGQSPEELVGRADQSLQSLRRTRDLAVAR
jgi:diguanylate cyclase (GGDEF)-like protein